jgi:hypothetical protein
MAKAKILVTAAAGGTQGKTGRHVALARGWNAHAVEHLSSLWKALRAASLSPEAGRFAVTDAIEKIGGTKPRTFEQFVREQQNELVTQPSPA